MIVAHKICDLIGTHQITLKIGNKDRHLKIPEGVLLKIPYFEKCLRNNFTGTASGAFNLTDESLATVKALVTWVVKGLDDPKSFDAAEIAVLADTWCCEHFMVTCHSALWDKLRAVRKDSGQLAQIASDLYKTLQSHRMRYIILHFLVAYSREGGFNLPQQVMADQTLCIDYAKWDFIYSLAHSNGHKAITGKMGHELLRRLLNVKLTLAVIKEDFHPGIVDHGDDWLSNYLDI